MVESHTWGEAGSSEVGSYSLLNLMHQRSQRSSRCSVKTASVQSPPSPQLKKRTNKTMELKPHTRNSHPVRLWQGVCWKR